MRTLLLMTIMIFASCASIKETPERKHQEYLSKVGQQKKLLKPEQYKSYISRELGLKESHLKALKDHYDREGEREIQLNQSGSMYSDIKDMNVRNSHMQLHKISEQIKVLEKEIFFLKSQLSSLD